MGFWKKLGIFNMLTSKTPGQFFSGYLVTKNEIEKEKEVKNNIQEYEIHLKNCANCGIKVDDNYEKCPNCGLIFHKNSKQDYVRDNSVSNLKLNNQLITDFSSYKSDGQYLVGKHIKSGEYLFFSPNGNGIFALSSDKSFDGYEEDPDEKIIMGIFLNLENGNYLRIRDGYLIDISNNTKVNFNRINGCVEYRVGIDIKDGYYTIKPRDKYLCAYYRLYNTGFKLSGNTIIKYGSVDGEYKVELKNGEYLYLDENCEIKII